MQCVQHRLHVERVGGWGRGALGTCSTDGIGGECALRGTCFKDRLEAEKLRGKKAAHVFCSRRELDAKCRAMGLKTTGDMGKLKARLADPDSHRVLGAVSINAVRTFVHRLGRAQHLGPCASAV